MGQAKSKPSTVSTFVFKPEDYYGDWIEFGRYPDPTESVCNDVILKAYPLTSSPTVGSFKIIRQCGCNLSNDKVCGSEIYDAVRVEHTNTYQTVNPVDGKIGGQFTIVWTDYTKFAIVSTVDRLWIYRRPSITDLNDQDLYEIYIKVLKMGFDPHKVILDGATIRLFAKHNIYTGTLIDPFCNTKVSERYGSALVCSKVPGYQAA